MATETETLDAAQVLEAKVLKRHKAMNEATLYGTSDVQQFYSGAVVFLTGGSGFLGKQLIEKLIRATKITKVFVLMRPKKGKTIEERLNELFKEPVYDMLREQQPDFTEKIIPVAGDVAELRLGMSDEDWKTLAEQVHIIFHLAATIRFDEPLKVTTMINVRGTRETLNLGKACKNLKSFVHVSTAYSHACDYNVNEEIQEVFCKCPVEPEVMIRLAESVDEERLVGISAGLTKNWPNTYSFGKALAEELVRTMSEGMPICVVRPAVVIASEREPSPGWVDMSNVFGASGLVLALGLGVMHALLCDANLVIPFTPVDYVNNATIAAGWETAKSQANGGTKTKIYTVTTSTRNRVIWRRIESYLNEARLTYSTPAAVWFCFVCLTSIPALFRIHFWLIHTIPAYIADGVSLVLRKERRFVKTVTKLQTLMVAISRFTLNTWNFTDNNTAQLYDSLSIVDKEIFNFDVTKIDWQEYLVMWFVGIRKYIIKDGLRGSEYGRKKQLWFKILTFILMPLYFYSLYKILCFTIYLVISVCTFF